MKKILFFATAAALMAAGACTTSKSNDTDYTAWVNPFIGTGGHGHTFPGPTMPHGMIQPGPDTRITGWDACSGYHYSDTVVNGFAQSHLSGTGCADYGDFLIMPTVGEQVIDPQIDSLQNRPYASAFSHADEIAVPGYYSTFLKRYGIKTEITSTSRAAIYRFTYPESEDPGLILDLDYAIYNQRNLKLDVEVLGDTAIKASKITRGWGFDQQLNMYACFSKPFKCEIVRDTITNSNGYPVARCKALLKFQPTQKDESIYAKIGISSVDTDGAEKNLTAEIPGWNFEKVRTDANDAWNDYLSKIDITADNDSDKTIFYTALYHSAISPNLFTDVDGRHLGMDKQPRQGDAANPVYTVFSLWDTHRALHPLMTIIDPQLNNLFIKSLLDKYDEGGLLPMWELSGDYTATMTGYHSVSLMADAISKNIADFDIEKAYEAARKSSNADTTGIKAHPAVRRALYFPSKAFKNTLGFIPWNEEHESVAKGLEYAYDDWCIATIAEAAGDTAGVAEFTKKGKAYKEYFDPVTRFMRGKDAKGKWHEPFSPYSSNHREDDYCEGTAWQWTWFVPHDVEGLVELMGGREAFIEKLDSLFTADSRLEGETVSADISGLIGQYAHGNEPSHHITHLYNYVGRPDRTQELVDQVLKEQYRADFDGLSGNEDCGQMSAWYILNSLGFYQVSPGTPVYSIGRPWFPHAEIKLPNGKSIVIDVKNYSKENKYIKSVKLNGKTLDAPFFNHSDIVDGAVFEYEMSATPEPTAFNSK